MMQDDLTITLQQLVDRLLSHQRRIHDDIRAGGVLLDKPYVDGYANGILDAATMLAKILEDRPQIERPQVQGVE